MSKIPEDIKQKEERYLNGVVRGAVTQHDEDPLSTAAEILFHIRTTLGNRREAGTSYTVRLHKSGDAVVIKVIIETSDICEGCEGSGIIHNPDRDPCGSCDGNGTQHERRTLVRTIRFGRFRVKEGDLRMDTNPHHDLLDAGFDFGLT